MNIYALLDKKSHSFSSISASASDDTVKRDFSLLLKMAHPSVPMKNFPQDYDIYRISSFDERTGKAVIDPSVDPCFVCPLSACIESIES